VTYTFAEAKQQLARFASAYGLTGLSGAVNEALDELAHTRSWQKLRKIVRLTVSSEYFTLPQDCGEIRRASIDGVPTSVYGADHEFLSSGPGDFDLLSRGLAPLHGVQRTGTFSTMYAPTEEVALAAFSTSVPAGDIKAIVRNADGDIVTLVVPCTAWASPDDADTLSVSAVSHTATTATEILGITLPSDAEAYISLYGIAADEMTLLSRMHPKIRVPEFTRYRMPGFSGVAGETYRVLVECGMNLLPLVEDDEPMPFNSLRPVQYMLQSFWAMDAGEIKQADEYRARAESELLRREDTDTGRQSLQIINPLYEGSNGEVSNYWENA
jgi:hypothetical protein